MLAPIRSRCSCLNVSFRLRASLLLVYSVVALRTAIFRRIAVGAITVQCDEPTVACVLSETGNLGRIARMLEGDADFDAAGVGISFRLFGTFDRTRRSVDADCFLFCDQFQIAFHDDVSDFPRRFRSDEFDRDEDYCRVFGTRAACALVRFQN